MGSSLVFPSNDEKSVIPPNDEESAFICPLLKLNDDCFAHIFKYLNWKDTVNFAASDDRIKDSAYLRYKQFKKCLYIDAWIIRRRDGLFDSIVSNLTNVRSLSINLKNVKLAENVLEKVRNHCRQLRTLEVQNWHEESPCGNASYVFDGIEILTMKSCHMQDLKIFFNRFRNLKAFNITGFHYGFSTDNLKMIVENNRDMESFYLYGGDDFGGDDGYWPTEFHISDFEFIQFGPNFTTLYMQSDIIPLDCSLMVRFAKTNLTKLKLQCPTENLNGFLTEMATRGKLEELELSTELSRDTLDILQLFGNLKLLVLNHLHGPTGSIRLDASIVFPPNLKQLRLVSFTVTQAGLISTIRQLRRLKNFDLSFCKYDKSLYLGFRNRSTIYNIGNILGRQRILDLILPDIPVEPIYNSTIFGPLRIRCIDGGNRENPIGIKFPGITEQSFKL